MKRVLFPLIAFMLLLFGTTAAAQEIIATPILDSVSNFRDIAGVAVTSDGTGFSNPTRSAGFMRTNVFYRSNKLLLSDSDWGTVSALRLQRDIDLRDTAEITAAPDRLPAGSQYTNINIFGDNSTWNVTNADTPQAMVSAYETTYREFVTDPSERSKFRQVFLTLAHDSGPDLYHCSSGKDRTGWTSAILETIAGVSSSTIMSDFMASNQYLQKSITTTIEQNPGDNPETIVSNVGVRESYLQTSLDAVTENYGSMYGYLIQGLGLSLEDIYVLRGKMVYYTTLPGQAGFSANDASGAALLNALQNSSLSGQYTAYNYYLQSSVDAGSLGGVQRQVGGQVHADAAAYLLRQPQRLDATIAPQAAGRELQAGESRVWLAGMGGEYRANGRSGVSESTAQSAGPFVGLTRRVSDRTSFMAGVGYDWGRVESVGAASTVNTVMGTVGGRYGFTTLDAGPYVTARAFAGWVDYQTSRPLGAGLGSASGQTNGGVLSAMAGVGSVWRPAPMTITPQLGFRVSHESLGGFSESGSELALGVHGIDNTTSSLLADVEVVLDARQAGSWILEPAVNLGYERILPDARVRTTATTSGYAVSQESAFDSQDLFKAGLALTASRGALTLKARANAALGDGSGSSGLAGQLSVAYSF